MININDNLLNILTPDELWMLCHLVKGINLKTGECVLKLSSIQKRTGFGRDKVRSLKKSIHDKGIMEVFQRYDDKGRLSDGYLISREHIGLFLGQKDIAMMGVSQMADPPEIQEGDTPENQGGKCSINVDSSINKIPIRNTKCFSKEKTEDIFLPKSQKPKGQVLKKKPSNVLTKHILNEEARRLLISGLRRHWCMIPESEIDRITAEHNIHIQPNKYGRIPGIKRLANFYQNVHDHGYDIARDNSRGKRGHQATQQALPSAAGDESISHRQGAR